LLVIIGAEYVIRRKWNRVAHFKHIYTHPIVMMVSKAIEDASGSKGKDKTIPL